MNRYWIAAVALVVLLGFQIVGHGQGAAPGFDSRLRERYDVVALQRGIALVPREPGTAVRMIQIVDGVVTVDGETLTGAELRTRLGPDADLVLQASYLSDQQQRGAVAAGEQAAGAGTSRPVERTEVMRGDRVRFGEDLRIAANERVEGDVAVFGGSADVDGEVTGDLAVFGGSARLGPSGVVRGDVSVMGGSLDRAPGARVLGRVSEMGGRRGVRHGWVFPHLFGSAWSRLGSLVGTVARMALLVLLGIIAAAFGRGPVERIAARAAASPLRSGLVGLLGEILFLPVVILTCVVLAVSIVGIPLLVLVPFAVLLLMLVMLVGFVGLAHQIGGRIAERLGRTAPGRYATVAIGVLAIGTVTLVAKLAALAGGFLVGAPLSALGYAVEYVAWTVGFGAATLAWYETQTRFGPRRQAPAEPPPAI